MKKRALICSQSDFSTDYRIHKMAYTLREADYAVSFLGRSHPTHMCKNNEETHIMRLLFWHGPLFYAELNIRILLYLLFEKKYNLVVSIDLDTLGGCLVGSKLRKEHLLFDSHEYFPGVPEITNKTAVKWVWNKVQDWCVPHVEMCVTVCQSIADIFKRKYSKNFLVIRNVPLAERIVVTEHKERKPGEPFTLLYQGAVNIGRGLEESIIALKSLEDCRLIVVGDGDVMGNVKELAKTEGVENRVTFTGRRPFSELGKYMAQADLGIVFMQNICPNYYYSLPNRIFDFIMAGVPILGIDFPEIARIVKGYDVGICIESLSPESVREAVEKVKNDVTLSRRWRENMKRVAPELTWEKETEGLRTWVEGI